MAPGGRTDGRTDGRPLLGSRGSRLCCRAINQGAVRAAAARSEGVEQPITGRGLVPAPRLGHTPPYSPVPSLREGDPAGSQGIWWEGADLEADTRWAGALAVGR